MTELMKQYLAVKKNHPDDILFFRLGDFYEMFFEDAKTAARILGIALTARFKDDKRVPMAGVPYHSATTYINRLLKAGHRVAVCEQTEPADLADGLVDRAVVRIITPGTLLEEGLIQTKQHNFVCAVNIDKDNNRAGLAWADLSTGKFMVEDIPLGNLLDELRRITPSECLVPEYLDYVGKNEKGKSNSLLDTLRAASSAAFTVRPAWVFERTTAYKILLNHFQTTNLDGFGCDDLEPAIGSAGAIIDYLMAAYPSERDSALRHITKLERFSGNDRLYLDRTTISSLELTATVRTNQIEGSLLGVLDKTVTPMGARILKEWITAPLIKPEHIRYRQQGVSAFVRDINLRKETIKYLKSSIGGYDIERYTGRIGSSRANARDLIALKNTLAAVPGLKTLLKPVQAPVVKEASNQLDPLPEFQKLVNDAIADEPPIEITEGGIIKEGYNEELDKLRSLASAGKDWINRFQSEEIKRTGINSLKVGYNQVFGYYIEITNVHSHKIPANYTRKQTLKNAERYITPELKDYETQVLNATERSRKMEHEIFLGIRKSLESYISRLQQIAQAIGLLDVLVTLAQVAQENNYCQPEVNDSYAIKITDGRHPVLEKVATDKFVPNDTALDNQDNRVLIITGPNMAGKSTYIRQVALICLMAQMGGYVPAKQAVIGTVDRIFTRIGSGDELIRGASTFMVEMNETANILNNATERSLIILDEVGRGTSTFDGLAISWAVTEYIHDYLSSRTLFATHYHELTDLSQTLPGIKNYHIEAKEWGDKIIFLHKILVGGTDKSYGIQVSRLAGLPAKVIDRAREVLVELEKRDVDKPVSPHQPPPKPKQNKSASKEEATRNQADLF